MFLPEQLPDRVVLRHLLRLQPVLVLDVEQDGLLLDEQLDHLDVASLAGAHQAACQAELLARQRGSLLQQTSDHFSLNSKLCNKGPRNNFHLPSAGGPHESDAQLLVSNPLGKLFLHSLQLSFLGRIRIGKNSDTYYLVFEN